MRKDLKIPCSNPQNNEKCKLFHKGRSKDNLCRSCSAKLNYNDIRTGKTYEDLFGSEVAKTMKERASANKNKWNENNKDFYKGVNNPNYGNVNPNKGKKWEEIYGYEKAAEMKENNSIRAREFIFSEKGKIVLEKLIETTKKVENRVGVFEKWVKLYGIKEANHRMEDYVLKLRQKNAKTGLGRFGERNGKVLSILRENGISYEEYLGTKSEFNKYRTEVNRYTKQQPVSMLENYSKRGLAGVKGAYHLDHIYSIKQGFIEGIPANVIGDIKNLRFIPWEDNIKKSSKLTNEAWDMFSYFIESEMI
jgi:hypothetical protein